MKILHFYRSYFPETCGGIEAVIYQVIKATQCYGVYSEVLTLTRSEASRIKVDNHFVHRSRLNFEIASTGFSAPVVRKFLQLSKEADIIHYHFPWPFMDCLHLFLRIDKPCVLTYHSDIVRQKFLLKLYEPLMRIFLKKVDKIVVTSPNYLQTSRVLIPYREKVCVIPIGIDKNSYPVPSKQLMAAWRERLGNKFYVFIGVLRYYKGLHILLDAVQNSSCCIVIVGSGPEENSIKQQAQRLKLKNVIFLGFLSDLDKVAVIKLSYAMVFPSHLRSEAFGVALLESAMFAKPMISCEIGTGTSYVNLHGQTGLVVAPNNSQLLREAMETLWNNEDLAKIMGRQASQRYEKYFTAKCTGHSYLQIYNELYAGICKDH